MKKLAAMLMLAAAMISPAHAADNSCRGTVVVVDAWTWIGDCTFKTESKVGRKILAVCPYDSTCRIIDGPRAGDDRTITGMPRKIEKGN
jgi:hypothetical protein